LGKNKLFRHRGYCDLPGSFHYFCLGNSRFFVQSFFVGNRCLLVAHNKSRLAQLRELLSLGVRVSDSSMFRWETGCFKRCHPTIMFYFSTYWGCSILDLVSVGEAVTRGESPDVSMFKLPDIEELRSRAKLWCDENGEIIN